MTPTDSLRAAHSRTIAENPVQITLTRTVQVSDGAGGTFIQTSAIGPLTVCLVPVKQRAQTMDLVSGSLTLAPWSLLAAWNADVQAGDTFAAGGRSYRVRRIIPRQAAGVVWGLQADLEEVS